LLIETTFGAIPNFSTRSEIALFIFAEIPKIAHIRILVKGFGAGAFLFLNPSYDCCK
jgi:hypothetical protein